MVSLLVGIASSAIVSAIAAYFGVLLGLNRVRRETAFERRLRWCEETLTRLYEAGSAVVRASHSDNLNEADEEDAWKNAVMAYRALLPHCAQKELYANEFALKAIQIAMDSMVALLQERAESGGACKQASAHCLKSLQGAVTQLTVEARAHLGFEKLCQAALNADKRFLDYIPPAVLRRVERPLEQQATM